MSKRAKLSLSLFGVALSVVGFYVSNAPQFPRIQALIAPSYVAAGRGLEAVRRDGNIGIGADGFAALAELIEDKLAEQNPSVPRAAIELHRLEALGGGMAFGRGTSRQVVGLKMFLQGQEEPIQWDLLELSAAVEDMWKEQSLAWAQWVFWIGVVQTVWPLFVETKANVPNGEADNTA